MWPLFHAILLCAAAAAGRAAAGHPLHPLGGPRSQAEAPVPWPTSRCPSGSACVIPDGETWLLNVPVEVANLTILGSLIWDITKDDLVLRTGSVLLAGNGYLEIGSQAAPMEKRATVFITEGSNHSAWGTRFLFGQNNSAVRIHGRALVRTWTLLRQTAPVSSRVLQLRDTAASMGWKVGDTIGIATTNRGTSRPYTITSIEEGYNITIDPPLIAEHLGGIRQVRLSGASGSYAGDFEMAAEVVNLERTVVITGEPNWDTRSREGLHTGMTGMGFMDVRYARVENCGQPPQRARYCLHFHHMHQCPLCVFQGNAVVNGTQVGITVHGTHRSLVDDNVLWNTASVGVYVEDGNEMNNTISENVIICMHPVPISEIAANKPPENCQYELFNDPGRLGGIFAIGMTNNFINNRIVNMENGIWTKGTQNPVGQGLAAGRVCTTNAPFLKFSGNVCHDNRRFGVYPDNQQPRNLVRDDNGMLPRLPNGDTDWSSCAELTPDGRDNGISPANMIEDEFDYHNMFVGQYDTTDIGYLRYTGVNNGHCMYWKSSKNFVDPTAYHMRDSICVSDLSDPVFQNRPDINPTAHVAGPAGAFTFLARNVTFAGFPGSEGALAAGQHCMLGGAGGPCAVQYLLEDVRFLAMPLGSRFVAPGPNAADPGKVLPIYISPDGSLGKYQSIVSQYLDGFSKLGCVQLGVEYSFGYGCPFPVRRLNIWSPQDLGYLRISGPGYDAAPNMAPPVLGQNAGFLQYAPGYNGYGAVVVPGKTYVIEANWTASVRVDFSDKMVPALFGQSGEWVTVQTQLGVCTVRSQDAHGLYYTRLGPTTQSAAGDCNIALGGCYTSVPGELCYQKVQSVLTTGLQLHPEKYLGITATSSFEDVQAVLHRLNLTDCPRPCAREPTPSPPLPSPTPAPTPAPSPSPSPAPPCHTAVSGEKCYGNVVWAMQHGIFMTPATYVGLSSSSSFEAFQAFLNNISWGDCPVPCPPCHTATPADACYKHVQWAKTYGINIHPQVYGGLTSASSFEDIQALLHATDWGDCPVPCPEPVVPVTCRLASPGETCYGHVVWAIQYGIRLHPEWYEGLTANSSFTDFQGYLYQIKYGDCPQPCITCHTAKLGEACYPHVQWAMQHGIVLYPDWYRGLTQQSSFEDFQAFLHRINHGNCSEPCRKAASSDVLGLVPPPAPSSGPAPPQRCHTAVPGDLCYGQVEWARQWGINLFPALYPGLTQASTFEEFQALLHNRSLASCPKPCSQCHTAVLGETCHGRVQWAMRYGITMFPFSYTGLTSSSKFEEVQAFLHQHGRGGCPMPCTACHTATPSENCYEHVMWAQQSGIRTHPERYPGLLPDSSFEAFQAFLHSEHFGGCSEPCAAPLGRRPGKLGADAGRHRLVVKRLFGASAPTLASVVVGWPQSLLASAALVAVGLLLFAARRSSSTPGQPGGERAVRSPLSARQTHLHAASAWRQRWQHQHLWLPVGRTATEGGAATPEASSPCSGG